MLSIVFALARPVAIGMVYARCSACQQTRQIRAFRCSLGNLASSRRSHDPGFVLAKAHLLDARGVGDVDTLRHDVPQKACQIQPTPISVRDGCGSAGGRCSVSEYAGGGGAGIACCTRGGKRNNYEHARRQRGANLALQARRPLTRE